MAGITKFEDIDAWRKGRELARLVYAVSAQPGFSRDYGLRDQMRRAAVSVLSNVAEGFERGGDREFRQFLALAKGSTGELKAQFYVALDAGYLSQQQFDTLYALAGETSRLLGGFIRYLTASKVGGIKFRPGNEQESKTSRPDTRSPDQRPETRDQRPETRDQRPETGGES